MDPSDEEESADVVERPDGYYWVADDGTEVGPFASYEAAEADRDRLGDEVPEPGESVEEAEAELGINQWLDSETGEPAEGQSPPHLEAD